VVFSYQLGLLICLLLQGEEDDENDGDQDEEGDGFFVPHGYLSDGEGCDDDDDDGKVIGCYSVKLCHFLIFIAPDFQHRVILFHNMCWNRETAGCSVV